MSLRHSKIQKQVLSLYKACLRASQNKPGRGFDHAVRNEFKKNATAVEKKDFLRIEHLMRQGHRKLDMIKDPNVSGMGMFVDENKSGK